MIERRAGPLAPAWWVGFALLLLAAGAWSSPPDAGVAGLLAKANELYEAGEFAQSAATYERCLDAGGRGADVLYNLGNAYARQQNLGRALAAYEAARRLAPRDPDLLHNIQQVAALRTQSVPTPPQSWLATTASAIVARRTENELVAVALLLLVGCAGLGVAVLLGIGPVRRLLVALCVGGLLLVVLVCAVGAKHSRDHLHPPAFICARDAPMRSGPGEHFELSGTLGDGAQVRSMRQSGLWTEVVLPTGKRAWVRRDHVARM